MHPILFEIGGFPRLHLRRAAGRRVSARAAVRAGRAPRKRGLDPNQVMDLGIWIIISALVGAKLLLLLVEFDKYRRQPAELAEPAPLGRRLLRRAHRGGRRGAVVPAAPPACRCGRSPTSSRPASRSATSSAASAACSPAAASAGRPTCPGRSRSTTNTPRRTPGTPLGIPLHPTQLYEAGAELLILGVLLADRTEGPAVSRHERSGATCSSTASRASSSSSTAATRAGRWSVDVSRRRSSCRS